jgi:DNA polymerase elongation subunit (family B)
MLFIDVEIYSNYFLLSCLDYETRNVFNFEIFEKESFDVKKLISLLTKHTLVSFNGNNFDFPIISAAVSGAKVETLKNIADRIIKQSVPGWKIYDLFDLRMLDLDHIDLFEVAPGRSSLKIYGGRLHAKKIQDLPFEHSEIITEEKRKILKQYCLNDLEVTEKLYLALKKQIDLRHRMSEQYGMDLRSKSDAQIAETLIKSELKKTTGKNYTKPSEFKNAFKYKDPKIINFKTSKLKELYSNIMNTDFHVGANGSVVMPEWLRNEKIKIGKTEYQLGIGGIHSCEKSQYIERKDGQILCDMDVASYYPSILLQQKLSPKSLGVEFLKLYQSLVKRRLAAKRRKDFVESETLKICLNGSFGKLGSKYSFLYAPELLIQTTITGQLALLMLIERLELENISVVSANTDGVVIYTDRSKEDLLEEIAFDWSLDTSFQTEKTEYKCLASRDVNNYCAVTLEGKIKGKGCFASDSLAKNPDMKIIYDSVSNFISTKESVSNYIYNCKDITKFVTVRRVQGGAVWKGEDLGKAVRFYWSNEFGEDQFIEYKTNGNKVPKSSASKPLMELPVKFPDDVDYERYVGAANQLLKEVGCNA